MDDLPMQKSEKQQEQPMAAAESNDGHHKKVPSYLKGTASSNLRSRSQSFDKNNSSIQQQQHQLQKPNTPSRSSSLDPTGMFRNRGRRVITKSSSAAAANNNNHVVTASNSSAQQTHMSGTHNSYNGQQRDQRAVHLAKESVEKNVNESNTAMVEDGHENDNIETNSTVDEIIQKQLPSDDAAPQSAATNNETAKERIIDDNAEDNEIKEIDDESDDSPIISERDSNPNNDSACNESTEFVPTITLESLRRFEFQDNFKANQLQSLHNKDGKILKRSFSNDSTDSEQCHSAIGSTVSVMGSLVGENEGTTIGSFGYDESKLFAVKRRMMQDVEEIVELDENMSDSDADDIRDDEDDRPLHVSSPLHTIPTVNESVDCNAEEARSEDDHASESKMEDDEIVDVSDNVQTNVTSNDVANSSSGDNDHNSIKAASNIHDESPIRAALRRKTQSVAKSLPPLPSHLSALTPNRFHSSYAKTENAVASGLKVAQQCFSFEDTTVDDSNFLIMPEKLNSGGDGGAPQPTHKYYGLSGVASFASEDDGSPTERSTPKRNSNASNNEIPSTKQSSSKKSASRPKWYPPMSGGGTLLSPKVIRHRQVWDDKKSPIRVSASGGNGGIRLSSSFDPSPLPRRDSKVEADRNEALTLLRSIVMQSSHTEQDEKDLDIQSLHCESCQSHLRNTSVETSSIRHDNCPSCLDKVKSIADSIKRGIIAENDDNSEINNHEPKLDNPAQCAAINLLVHSHEYAIQMKQSALLARKWLESIGEAESIGIVPSTANNVPMPVHDDTDGNFEAAEHTILSKQEEISRLNSELSKCRAEIGRLKCSPREQQIPALTHNKSILSDSSSDNSSATDGNNSLNLTSPFPTVKYCDSHDESYIRFEKRIEADMNLENRKEIIFLKAALEKANKKIAVLEHDSETCQDKEEPFESEIEAIDASTTIEGSEDMIIQIAKSIENISVGSSSLPDEEESQNNKQYSISIDDPRLEKELEEYRLALIESLRVEEGSKNTAELSTAASSNVKKDVSNSISSELSTDKRMVNVRMIDGENFTTKWSDLVEPLPPPPDHGLKSPIVDAILSKWTDDSNTQSALVKWIESILNGDSSDDSPSLKLSGLDHQIRDGFIMHVLPLLLLRKDIHVHVTSRAHRQTTYDMAVSISQSVKGSTDMDNNRNESRTSGESIHRSKPGGRKHHLMAYQAAHSGSAVNSNGGGGMEDSNIAPSFSARQFLGRTAPDIVRTSSHTESISTAVTAQISNRTPSQAAKNLFRSHAEDSYTTFSEMKTPSRMPSVPPPALGDDLSVGSSVSEDDSKSQRQSSSIMGSISGAFGGLLSRRKGPQPSDLYHPLSSEKSPNTNSSSWSPSTLFTPQSNHSQEEVRHDDIYHRVVSAPPGKIGLTFVEYEGNTMVSNVSDSSPLSGWVFPSDVLVAIDDTPVRDLRTRDIVQLLTEKKDQQRNLRMYSLNRR
eukprot:scaffold2425_cov76-Skeletonema_dohrnii-CCMP3373.AAC.36